MPLTSRSWSANSERTRARAYFSTLVALTALAEGMPAAVDGVLQAQAEVGVAASALGVPW